MPLPARVRSAAAAVPGASRVVRRARRWRQRRRGSLWRPPGHFYSPITSPEEVRADAVRIWPSVAAGSMPGIDLRLDEQVATLQRLGAWHDELPAYGSQELPGYRFRTHNGMFGMADAAQLMLFMRLRRPRRIVEVGSGFSSAAMLDAAEHLLERRPSMTFVEPYPDRLDALLRPEDRADCEVLVARVQDLPITHFTALTDGDILVVDSSHVAKTGSDVNHLLFEVLPRLEVGVLVHFHDIGFPFEYPRHWVEEGRSWNEAYLLRAFLSFNPAFRIELWNGALRTLRPEVFEGIPKLRGGSQLWIRRVA